MERVCDLPLPDGEWRTLMQLARRARDDGTGAYPSVGRLARESGKQERAVQRSLRSLQRRGLILPIAYRHGGRGHATEYRLALPETNGKGVLSDTLSSQRVSFVTEKGVAGDTPIRPERTEEAEECKVGASSGRPTTNGHRVSVPEACGDIDGQLREAFGEAYRPSAAFYAKLQTHQAQGVDLLEILARLQGLYTRESVKNACALVLEACKREASGTKESVPDGEAADPRTASGGGRA
jgi:hypothetical protein